MELGPNLLLAWLLSMLYIVPVVGLEIARRRFGFSSEVTRRVVHVFSGLCTLLDFVLLPGGWFLALIAISLVGIALSQRFGWLKSVHAVSRRTYGEVFLPLGTISTYFVSQGNAHHFVPSVLVMTLADAACGVVSDLLKLQRKSWQGSLAFAFVSLAIMLVAGVGAWKCLVLAAALTVVERVSRRGSDNLTVPVASALLMTLLKA